MEPASSPDEHDDDIDEEHNPPSALAHTATRTSVTSSASRPPDYEVTLDATDPENPRNWPLWYRTYTVLAVSYATWVVVLYSTSYMAAIPGLMADFGVADKPLATMGLTSYLLGLAAGSVVVAPMSELYGRRAVYLVCMGVFVLLIVPCGVAGSLGVMVGVRFIGAVFGAAMISNSPGTIVDIAGPETLALCMSWYSIAPLNGPVTGPLIGGVVYENLGWRWSNWLAMILAGVAVAMLALVKETYPPTLMQRKAARLRKETGDGRWWCRHDQRVSTLDLLKTNLSRPFVLAATEPILWFFNIWISVIYGILYLCFIAYPIVFTQHRGWTVSQTGLSFLGIGLGTLLAIILEPLWRRLILSSSSSSSSSPPTKTTPTHSPLATTTNPTHSKFPTPEATALVMCIGAVLTPLGQLTFSLTSLPRSIHPSIPIALGGIPFGMGNTLSFIYGSNYLASAYGLYAASALAGNAVLRSVVGAALPLAGPALYAALTPRWAGVLLGGLECLLIPIPFVFWRYGDRIRDRSRVIRLMREERDKTERREARVLARKERREVEEERRVRVREEGEVVVVVMGVEGDEEKKRAAAQGARMA
ncbi:MFS general substrate transporter [Parathielavia appendiculata]|uniref:MFS general substrate transporter n=1 Tax=Parathielavia appendiculata TaxID=2587402 RepID=A0AAN6U1M6_9PEZI|nr:MFS general substrate transporter [Parathielavia appendiculata]